MGTSENLQGKFRPSSVQCLIEEQFVPVLVSECVSDVFYDAT